MKNSTLQIAVGLTATVAAFGAAALSAHADTTTSGSLDATFAKTIGHANVDEIKISRLALQKSHNEKVRQIANMLIMQHSQAQAALIQTGHEANRAVPQAPDPQHQEEYTKLASLSGNAFDKAFLQGMVHDHYKAIGLFQKEMANGDDSYVRSFAQEFLPTIQTHTQMITALASNMGIVVAESGEGHAASAALPAAGTSAPAPDATPAPAPNAAPAAAATPNP